MSTVKNQIGAKLRQTNLLAGSLFAGALAALLIAFALAGPAMADDGDIDGCCVCDCLDDATTSSPDGMPPAPLAGLCIDALGPLGCGNACGFQSCGPDRFEPTACNQVSGCAQANARTMAPAASPLILTAIALALAALGVYTIRPATRQ